MATTNGSEGHRALNASIVVFGTDFLVRTKIEIVELFLFGEYIKSL